MTERCEINYISLRNFFINRDNKLVEILYKLIKFQFGTGVQTLI